jgi:hypothetical protein
MLNPAFLYFRHSKRARSVSAASDLEPRLLLPATQSGVPNHACRSAAPAFGMTVFSVGLSLSDIQS